MCTPYEPDYSNAAKESTHCTSLTIKMTQKIYVGQLALCSEITKLPSLGPAAYGSEHLD